MNYYMMESPLTLTTSSSVASHLEDFADIDFNLLLSFDQEDQDDKDLLFFFDELEEKKEGCDVAFPFPTSMNMNMNMNEIIELDVFDEVSLLSASTDNEMSYQLASIPLKVESNKKRCNKRKRNTVESTASEDEMSSQFTSTISKKQKINTATVATAAGGPLDYANKFIKTLNCGDMMEMQESMQSMCSEKVKVTKHYYPTIEELRAQEEFNRVHPEVKQEEFLSTMQFQSMTDFLHYLKMVNWIIPDGAFAIEEARCCHEGGKNSVFIASFSYSGTSLCATMNLLSNKMSLLNYNEETMMNVLNQACMQKSFRRYKTEGSIALYVNEEGLINEIEFFETRSIFN